MTYDIMYVEYMWLYYFSLKLNLGLNIVVLI